MNLYWHLIKTIFYLRFFLIRGIWKLPIWLCSGLIYSQSEDFISDAESQTLVLLSIKQKFNWISKNIENRLLQSKILNLRLILSICVNRRFSTPKRVTLNSLSFFGGVKS